jgi:hypothetical protein
MLHSLLRSPVARVFYECGPVEAEMRARHRERRARFFPTAAKVRSSFNPPAGLPRVGLKEARELIARRGTTLEALQRSDKRPHMVEARRLVAHLLFHDFGWRPVEIAKLLGYADHSGVVPLLKRSSGAGQ